MVPQRGLVLMARMCQEGSARLRFADSGAALRACEAPGGAGNWSGFFELPGLRFLPPFGEAYERDVLETPCAGSSEISSQRWLKGKTPRLKMSVLFKALS